MIQLLVPVDASSLPMEIVYSASLASSSRSSPADYALSASSQPASVPSSPVRPAAMLASPGYAVDGTDAFNSLSQQRASSTSSAVPLSAAPGSSSLWSRPAAAADVARSVHPVQAAAPASNEHVPLTQETMDQLNKELASRSPQEILLWLQRASLGNVIQFTSFGLSGMMITDLLSNMGWNIPIAFIDTLYHFPEVRDGAAERDSLFFFFFRSLNSMENSFCTLPY